MGGTGSAPGFLIGAGPERWSPPSQSIFQIQCLSTGWPARESEVGGRGQRKEAQCLWGSWALQKGAGRGTGVGGHLAPADLDSFPRWASSLSAGLAPPPITVAALGKQTPSPQLNLCRATGHLTKTSLCY